MKTEQQILFITGNQSKFDEIAGYIPGLKLVSLPDLPEIQSLDLREVVKAKLQSACVELGKEGFIIVEDTALYLGALKGFPGPLIKFMLRSVGNKGIYRLCVNLRNHKAIAECSFGLYRPDKDRIEIVSAERRGRISDPKGVHGFGWDCIFVPEGSSRTYAQMASIEEKNQYSMRAAAINALARRLRRSGIIQ